MKKKPLSKVQARRLAAAIRTEMDLLYADMTNNERNALSYHDACKITDYIAEAFRRSTGKVPDVIKGACNLARGLLNPNKMKQGQDLQRGLALLLVTAGGIGIVWGLLIALGVGLSIWAVIWGVIAGTTGPLTGGLMLTVAVAAVVAGIYVALALENPQTLSGRAHSVLIEAIEAWADTDKAIAKDAEAKKQIALKSRRYLRDK